MYPAHTIYRLAVIEDLPACNAILEAQFGQSWPLGFPTVVAERDGEILGLLSTNTECNWALMAGPLALKRPSFITVMRLCEAYEVVLRKMGVTRYCFFISVWNNKWIRQATEIGCKVIRSNDKNLFFERLLPYSTS